MLLRDIRDLLVKEIATENSLEMSTPDPRMGSEGRKVNVHFQLFHGANSGGNQAV
jgi:hypothetical protein